MRIRPLAELMQPDDMTRRFGFGFGFSPHGMLSAEVAAEHQQRAIADANLDASVPVSTQRSYERLRAVHAYGILNYDFFTICNDLTWVVLEQALRDRFVEYYRAGIPVVDRSGNRRSLQLDFEQLVRAFRKRGAYAKGWVLELPTGSRMKMPLTLQPLLTWGHTVGLLDGQRNRKVQLSVYPELRNHFAHGGGFHVEMPVDSARSVRDLGEIINRLWGRSTPGGRLYPLYPEPILRTRGGRLAACGRPDGIQRFRSRRCR